MRYYLEDKKALAYLGEKATVEFWDRHWEVEIDILRKRIFRSTSDNLFVPTVKKHLQPGSTILEGGCGHGYLVYALRFQGYKAIGVDFSNKTVRKVNRAVPDLDVRYGDVKSLSIEDGELDGYISVGVIEHFWEGYHTILSEMNRTLKSGGFLFISFPYMSPLRKLKATLGGYKVSSYLQIENHRDKFYQFAFNWQQVVEDMEKYGFTLIERKPFDGIKGFKDELTCFRPWLQPIYNGKKNKRIKPYIDILSKPFASHCILLVMQKSHTVDNLIPK